MICNTSKLFCVQNKSYNVLHLTSVNFQFPLTVNNYLYLFTLIALRLRRVAMILGTMRASKHCLVQRSTLTQWNRPIFPHRIDASVFSLSSGLCCSCKCLVTSLFGPLSWRCYSLDINSTLINARRSNCCRHFISTKKKLVYLVRRCYVPLRIRLVYSLYCNIFITHVI